MSEDRPTNRTIFTLEELVADMRDTVGLPAAVLASDSPSGFGHERLVTCTEMVMHPEDYAQLAESVGEASGGAGVRGVMVSSNPNMTKGTIGQRMSDGSWRFTSVGGTTREG